MKSFFTLRVTQRGSQRYLLSKSWVAFLRAWCPLPAFRSCFVEFTRRLNALDEFVGEKVFSPSYSSAILAPPPPPLFLCHLFLLWSLWFLSLVQTSISVWGVLIGTYLSAEFPLVCLLHICCCLSSEILKVLPVPAHERVSKWVENFPPSQFLPKGASSVVKPLSLFLYYLFYFFCCIP